ncbi:MAG: glycosyltransferase family 4 protein [Actinobacteria bacterium]|nr:MAG: glycosyltransferase family 4 protein [Actinomycetota bacterium]
MDNVNASGHRILCFATHGHEHLDAVRLGYLLAPVHPDVFPFDHAKKLRSAVALARALRTQRPSLVVMEGTGLAGGIMVLAFNRLLGIPFVVCSGDAVGPYLRLRSRLLGAAGTLYERSLCRRCAGYIGWTPYLAGRALTYGARRAMSAPGWARTPAATEERGQARQQLGIADHALVVGLVGSLEWTRSVGYVYGAELISAVRRIQRDDIVVCIVGDGSGRARLIEIAGEDLGSRVLLPGRVPAERVPDYLRAFDVASLSQSVDGVGAFRYTTKLSEYLAAELPIITSQVPLAYDLDEGYFWRLPGDAPWSPTYVDALVELLETISRAEVEEHRSAIQRAPMGSFDGPAQQRRVGEFIADILMIPGSPAPGDARRHSEVVPSS